MASNAVRLHKPLQYIKLTENHFEAQEVRFVPEADIINV